MQQQRPLLTFHDPAPRILIVDDDEVNQFVISSYLRKWGAVVTTASNGIMAIELVKVLEFDFVLMDLEMPGIDGFSTTLRIRMLPGDYFRNIPIIAFTASPLLHYRIRANESGMNGFLTKPCDPHDLFNKINSIARKLQQK